MLFIRQVVIDQPLFPVTVARVAHLFITEESMETAGQLETWNPKSGENAVIIQTKPAGGSLTIADGPRLMEAYWEGRVRMTRPLELASTVCIEPVPEELSEDERLRMDRRRQIEYYNALGQKVGGLPDWIQGDETPVGWRLLLQMHDYPWVGGTSIDTNWNFGTGSCYVFISPDYCQGILLWQC